MRTEYVDVDGRLHHARAGDHGPPAVLVHGLGGSHVNWLALGPRLADQMRVFAPDLAGHGRTPLTGRSATLDANRQLLDRYLEQVVGEPAVLVGNSMGGALAIAQAARAPETVRALVLLAPAAPRTLAGGIDLRVARDFLLFHIPGLGRRYLAWRRRRYGPRGVAQATLRLCTVDPTRVPADVVEASYAMAEARALLPWADDAFLTASRSLVRALADRRAYDDLVRGVVAPTLVVVGAQDRLVARQNIERLVDLRPNWRLEVFDDCGHVPQLEHPQRLADLIEGWLEPILAEDTTSTPRADGQEPRPRAAH